MKRHFTLHPLLLLAILGLAGCSMLGGLFGSGNNKGGASAKNPGQFDLYEVAYQLPLNIYAGKNLNAGASGQPLGLVVKIYQLRDYRHFQRAPLKTFLSSKSTQALLGDDLIAARQILLLPGENYLVAADIREATRYLGIVALFKSPARGRWRAAFDVGESVDSGITIGLHACALTVTRGELVTKLAGQADSLSMVECP